MGRHATHILPIVLVLSAAVLVLVIDDITCRLVSASETSRWKQVGSARGGTFGRRFAPRRILDRRGRETCAERENCSERQEEDLRGPPDPIDYEHEHDFLSTITNAEPGSLTRMR